jgi:hypothetical protein
MHDDESISILVARTGVLVSAEGRQSGPVGEVCIKEDETDCGRLVVLDRKGMRQ